MPTARPRSSKSDGILLVSDEQEPLDSTSLPGLSVRVVQRSSTPVFPTGDAGSIPVTDSSCPCRTVVSTPVSQPGYAGSIPVMDPIGVVRTPARSPCWAPRQLIPVRATVRFRRLRLLVRPAVEALHANKLVQLQSGPLHGPDAVGTAFSSKGKIPIAASTLGRAKKLLLVRRGASGEAMIVAPVARAVRSLCANERGVRFPPPRPSGCSSGVRARGRGPRGRWCDSSHSDDATVPRMGHETTNLVGWGSIPLGGTRLGVAQKQSAWVTTTMSLVQPQPSRLIRHRSADGTRFCEGRWLRFESSRWY